MLVSHILREKGRDVVSVTDDMSISDVVKVLSERRIGAVLVIGSAGGVIGILSERDIVRALANDGSAALQREARAYMTREVVACAESDSIEDVMETMTRGRFRHLPVFDDERLLGLVSIGDVVKSRIADAEIETQTLRQYVVMGAP